MKQQRQDSPQRWLGLAAIGLVVVAVLALVVWLIVTQLGWHSPSDKEAKRDYQPRITIDSSGYTAVVSQLKPWSRYATLDTISKAWHQVGYQHIAKIDEIKDAISTEDQVNMLLWKSLFYNYEGDPQKAYATLTKARMLAESDTALAEKLRYTFIYLQGVASLRRGEDENCILCRGESSCILPIAPSAVHTKPAGSRQAIAHFTEYLKQFPDDLEVRWLLNVAHMTLGEYPDKVAPQHLLKLDHFHKSEFDIGKFRDIGHLVGVNRFDQAGGAILEDFTGDGLLDIVTTSIDPTMPMAFYKNRGDGRFDDRAKEAGLLDQLGGMYCVQTDYNNDGHMDIFIVRGAWLPLPMRPSLLHNNGDGTFADVTEKAGLLDPVNSITASWADYDNDGWLDLYICCDNQANRLYRNRGNGTFAEVASKAGVQGSRKVCKGAAWLDYDNDDYPDLFLTHYEGTAQLFHNNRNGTFTDVTDPMGIDGPNDGFSCWAWDYDNDGWLDIFATSYDQTLEDVVQGLRGQPHRRHSNKLYHNEAGKRFTDRTKEAGLDMVFATMGSNFGDFDNDGFLDMYLGTGWPDLAMLVPNRMFKNVSGSRFAEITTSSGTGHLQKGHGVACGDWNRNGDVDILIQMGGTVDGDKYHNVLFQNPGQGNHWLTLKLIGKKTNRAAIGARIKIVTAGAKPLTIHRHVSSGSSFGANPLEQTIGLAKAKRIARLEIHWPTSGTTQVFRDVAVNQNLEVTELTKDFRRREQKAIPLPK